MLPIELDLTIVQGATFKYTLRWFDAQPTHVKITAVEVGLPTVITAPGHGLTGTREPVWINNVRGVQELNCNGYGDAEPLFASVLDEDTLVIEKNSRGAATDLAGAVLTYYPVHDLTGASAKARFRFGSDDDDSLDLDSDQGGVVLDADTGSITMVIIAATTQALSFNNATFTLQVTEADGTVTRIAQGSAHVNPDQA